MSVMFLLCFWICEERSRQPVSKRVQFTFMHYPEIGSFFDLSGDLLLVASSLSLQLVCSLANAIPLQHGWHYFETDHSCRRPLLAADRPIRIDCNPIFCRLNHHVCWSTARCVFLEIPSFWNDPLRDALGLRWYVQACEKSLIEKAIFCCEPWVSGSILDTKLDGSCSLDWFTGNPHSPNSKNHGFRLRFSLKQLQR